MYGDTDKIYFVPRWTSMFSSTPDGSYFQRFASFPGGAWVATIAVGMQSHRSGNGTQQYNQCDPNPCKSFHDAAPLRRIRTVITCNVAGNRARKSPGPRVSGNRNNHDAQVRQRRLKSQHFTSNFRLAGEAWVPGEPASGRRKLLPLGTDTRAWGDCSTRGLSRSPPWRCHQDPEGPAMQVTE
jgi:hypothetical protein